MYQRQILSYLIAFVVNRDQNRKNYIAVPTRMRFCCKDLAAQPAMVTILVESHALESVIKRVAGQFDTKRLDNVNPRLATRALRSSKRRAG